ncbi:MAG: Single-stranded DNA binding protein [Halobacteriaceae archaeon]
MTIEEHAEELASTLGVNKQEVQSDLETLVEYSVPIEEAKESLRRKYDDSVSEETPSPSNIADLSTDSGSVTVTGTILTVGKRPIRYQGEDHVILEGEIADETGKTSYTAWEEFSFEVGDTITIVNATIRDWGGEPELNFGEDSSVTIADESLDIDYTIGGERSMSEVTVGDRGISIEVKPLDVTAKTIEGRDGETRILSGVLADETAQLPFTDWDPHSTITEGDTVRLENVYVREFRGVPEINLSEFSTATQIDREIEITDPERVTIREAIQEGSAYNVEITGNIIQLRDGSGLIQRCPECGRVIQQGQCRTHGDVSGENELRTKAILDDGSGTVTVVFDNDLTEEIYGKSLEEAIAQAREAMDQEVVADTINNKLVGRQISVRGRLSINDYGANLDAIEFTFIEENPTDQAQRLLEVVQ